ncbi:hypothetical protein AGR4C_pa60052 [Agrobacterium tumefaciens str. Kerr 14]|uniref:Uncharacterized protein n=1 Tax=Agrobacterium tumefaciens str. Kerr 14 TaxID=1183424 RepID=A0A1S7SBQ1_AGRTU|nr:hypothetical protein [Agrobacterium tumefaciens]CUX66019.1 hypothetical protein AGR4C_pa60052 [Agrobacterium tumefaciens str. Kerr 14]
MQEADQIALAIAHGVSGYAPPPCCTDDDIDATIERIIRTLNQTLEDPDVRSAFKVTASRWKFGPRDDRNIAAAKFSKFSAAPHRQFGEIPSYQMALFFLDHSLSPGNRG